VLVFRFGVSHPPLDVGDAFECPAFVSHDGMVGKARAETLSVASVFGREVGGQQIG
jgi:hypothetical protein